MNFSNVEANLYHIAVLNDVLLALKTKHTLFTALRNTRIIRNEIIVCDNLRPDEPPCQVRMYCSRSINRIAPSLDRKSVV